MSNDTNAELNALGSHLSTMHKMIDERLSNDRVREKAFDKLYEELKQYKDDFLFQAEKPLLLDLLLFYDSLNWFQQSMLKADTPPDEVADAYQYLIEEFLEVLYRRDVLPMDASERFDRTIHKAVKVEMTEDPSKDYTIKRVLKRGFHRGEKMLRAEEVVINRHKKDARAS